MKTAIKIAIVMFLSILVWLKWGGLTNDMGTLIIAFADVFIITAIIDNATEKPVKK